MKQKLLQLITFLVVCSVYVQAEPFHKSDTRSFSSVTVSNISNVPVGRGNTNEKMIKIAVVLNGTNIATTNNITSISITMNSSTNVNNVTGIKVYYTGTTNTFSTTTQFGATAAQPATVATTVTFTGSLTALAAGTYYFWVVYDVSATATEGEFLDAACTSITVGGTARTPGTTNPAGSRLILLESSVVFKTLDQVSKKGAAAFATMQSSRYYRIPAITKASNGDLITATTARFTTPNDVPATENTIVIRRSTDKGKTWLAPQTIGDFAYGADDASFIVDTTNNTILCLFGADNGLAGSTSPAGTKIRLYMCKSTDNGVTWTSPTELSSQVYLSDFQFVWASAGNHIQLRNGRLIAVVTVRGAGAYSASLFRNTVIYSDDHGTTWNIYTTGLTNNGTPAGYGDESHVVEMNNGNLMMSSRRSGVSGVTGRRFRTSADNGATWSAAIENATFFDPRCNGDFIRYSTTLDGYDKSVLLHSLPNDNDADGLDERQKLSVYYSTNEGTSWTFGREIYPDKAQYSSLTKLADGTIGLYFEDDNTSGVEMEMRFVRFSLNWLAGIAVNPVSTLPVKLNNFDLSLQNNYPHLQWSSSDETSFRGYGIEHADDGKNFKEIAFTVSKKTAAASNNYFYTDEMAGNGIHYYRLKMLDENGTFIYSAIKTIKISKPVLIKIYPNPFQHKINIEIATAVQDQKYRALITDAKGNQVESMAFSGSRLSVSAVNWSKGTYFLQVQNEKGEIVLTKTIVKQ